MPKICWSDFLLVRSLVVRGVRCFTVCFCRTGTVFRAGTACRRRKLLQFAFFSEFGVLFHQCDKKLGSVPRNCGPEKKVKTKNTVFGQICLNFDFKRNYPNQYSFCQIILNTELIQLKILTNIFN